MKNSLLFGFIDIISSEDLFKFYLYNMILQDGFIENLLFEKYLNFLI